MLWKKKRGSKKEFSFKIKLIKTKSFTMLEFQL